MDQESGRGSKRYQISQRVEFASEGAFRAPHASDPSIQQIEDAGQKNQEERPFDGMIKTVARHRFDNPGQRQEAAEKISCRHEIREEIDFKLRTLENLDFPFRHWFLFWHPH